MDYFFNRCFYEQGGIVSNFVFHIQIGREVGGQFLHTFFNGLRGGYGVGSRGEIHPNRHCRFTVVVTAKFICLAAEFHRSNVF